MGQIVEINFRGGFFKRWWHKLFDCPTFWKIKPRFTCPCCGRKYRCYWDGNDVNHHINVCMKCLPEQLKLEKAEVDLLKGGE